MKNKTKRVRLTEKLFKIQQEKLEKLLLRQLAYRAVLYSIELN